MTTNEKRRIKAFLFLASQNGLIVTRQTVTTLGADAHQGEITSAVADAVAGMPPHFYPTAVLMLAEVLSDDAVADRILNARRIPLREYADVIQYAPLHVRRRKPRKRRKRDT